MTTFAPPIPNPATIAWARQDSGHTPERVAQRLHIPVDRLLAWEQGTHPPTLKQLERLAVFLCRPPSFTKRDLTPFPSLEFGHLP